MLTRKVRSCFRIRLLRCTGNVTTLESAHERFHVNLAPFSADTHRFSSNFKVVFPTTRDTRTKIDLLKEVLGPRYGCPNSRLFEEICSTICPTLLAKTLVSPKLFNIWGPSRPHVPRKRAHFIVLCTAFSDNVLALVGL